MTTRLLLCEQGAWSTMVSLFDIRLPIEEFALAQTVTEVWLLSLANQLFSKWVTVRRDMTLVTHQAWTKIQMVSCFQEQSRRSLHNSLRSSLEVREIHPGKSTLV